MSAEVVSNRYYTVCCYWGKNCLLKYLVSQRHHQVNYCGIGSELKQPPLHCDPYQNYIIILTCQKQNHKSVENK